MELILLVVQTIVAVLLIASVLVQRSSSDGFGLGGSSGGSGLISARGQSNLMTRITAILAAVFMLNSLVLTIITTSGSAKTLIDEVAEQPHLSAPVDGRQAPETTKDKNAENAPQTEGDTSPMQAPLPEDKAVSPDTSAKPDETQTSTDSPSQDTDVSEDTAAPQDGQPDNNNAEDGKLAPDQLPVRAPRAQ